MNLWNKIKLFNLKSKLKSLNLEIGELEGYIAHASSFCTGSFELIQAEADLLELNKKKTEVEKKISDLS